MSTTETTQTADTEVITREYECAYLFVPTIPEEKLSEHVEKVKKTLTDHGAELANEKQPQRIPLAYEMSVSEGGKNKRYLEGYFGWVTMEASPENVIEMRDELKTNYDLIRFMIIKAPKDQDPYATPGQDEEDGSYVSPQSEEEQKKQSTEVSTEEIDKSIDKLVSDEEDGDKAKEEEKEEDKN